MAKHGCHHMVFTCIDFRFRKYKHNVANQIGECDYAGLAGSAKSLVDKESRKTALHQIEVARLLHGVREVTLIQHEDCGATGGKSAFKTDKKEIAFHRKLVKKAASVIIKSFPEIKVKGKFVKLDGSTIDLDIK